MNLTISIEMVSIILLGAVAAYQQFQLNRHAKAFMATRSALSHYGVAMENLAKVVFEPSQDLDEFAQEEAENVH